MGFPWANLPGGNALHAWDFLNNTARWNSASVGALSNTPGWSFTRASTGYAQTSAGVLVPFASGELRRTDKGVLIEGARTNLCLQSQTFDNASWSKTGSGTASVPTVTADYAIAPDGTMTADRVQFALNGGTSTVDRSLLAQTIAISNATAYTLSFYVKSNGADVALGFGADSIVGNTAITATSSWQRVTVTATSSSTSCSFWMQLRGGQTPTHGNSADLSVWGAQLEAGGFVSSQIPTTTASATRAADVLTVPVSGIDYPQSLFAEFERVVDTGTAEALVYLYINGNNYSRLSVASTDAGQMSISAGGVTQANLLSAATISVGAVSRLAGRVASNDARMALNGVLTSADASVTFPVGTIGLYFGADGVGATPSFGYLRRAALWNRAISDAELQALTL